MDTTKMITAGGTIIASVATVALIVWQEAQASRYDEIAGADGSTPAHVTSASLLPVSLPEPRPEPVVTVEDVQPAQAPVTQPMAAETAPKLAKPAPQPEPALELASLTTDFAVPEVPDTPTVVQPAAPVEDDETVCAPVLTGAAEPGAIAALTLSAPCHADGEITVSHGEISFTDSISALGTYSVRLPVLADPADVTVELPDGTETKVTVDVDGLDSVERVALQSSAESGLWLHAFELGAEFGGDGHVWRDLPRDADYAVGGRGGFYTVLGDTTGIAPRTVQIYTYPADMAPRDGVVRLSVEAEVTRANCGRDIAGRSFQRDATGRFAPIEVTLSMPGCDAVGEYLVLKNLLRDLKLAAN